MRLAAVFLMLAALQTERIAFGQDATNNSANAMGLQSNYTQFGSAVSEQLVSIHRELQRLHDTLNKSRSRADEPSEGIQTVTHQVNRMLLYALPGLLTQTLGVAQDEMAPSFDTVLSKASDYGYSEIIGQAGRSAWRSVRHYTSSFIKSLDTLETISAYLSPARVIEAADKEYRGCHDAFLKGERFSGVYTIFTDRVARFRAWCDFDESGGWMVIQRRFDGTVGFCRNRAAYIKGFGSLWGEHWLGLNAISQLSQAGVRLSVHVEDYDRGHFWSNYSYFAVDGQNNNFRMSVSGFSGGTYDAMSYHSNFYFSTWDHDVDQWSGGNCAQQSCAGWWYNNCSLANPNARYDGPPGNVTFMSWRLSMNSRILSSIMRINA